jgi:hypothetical protein
MLYTILRLAGLYDGKLGVSTLTQQIARIYEKNLKSHLYAGDTQGCCLSASSRRSMVAGLDVAWRNSHGTSAF